MQVRTSIEDAKMPSSGTWAIPHSELLLTSCEGLFLEHPQAWSQKQEFACSSVELGPSQIAAVGLIVRKRSVI